MEYTLFDLLKFNSQTVLVTLKSKVQYRGWFEDHGEDQKSTYFILKPSKERILIPMEDISTIELSNP
jgi:hypothetical protein